MHIVGKQSSAGVETQIIRTVLNMAKIFSNQKFMTIYT